jgi:hypothetical protein
VSIILDFEAEGLVYFAIPKAANTSLRNWLLPLLPDRPAGQVRNIHQDVEWPRLSKEAFLARRKGTGTLSFAITRNPWTRLVSTYADKVLRETIHPPLGRLGFEAGMPFLDFVERVSEIPDREADVHIRSQWAFLTRDQRLLPDLVLDMSELPKLVRLLRAWSPERVGSLGDPARLNDTAARQDVPRFLDTPARRAAFEALVHRRFKREIQTFGYAFPY